MSNQAGQPDEYQKNAPRSVDAGQDRPRVLRSEELLQGQKEVWIEHGGEMYRLRLTSAGRLYLTK